MSCPWKKFSIQNWQSALSFLDDVFVFGEVFYKLKILERNNLSFLVSFNSKQQIHIATIANLTQFLGILF